MSSFPFAAENVARQHQSIRCDLKKMVEESRAVELALEGHTLIISGLCCTGKCFCDSKIIIFIFLAPL